MAIFRPGALIGGISGAIGGVVFSNTRGSRVVRHRPAVKGGAAPKHGTAQANFRFAQSAWATLTDQQRATWRTYAPQVPVTNRLGEQHGLSGFQAFVRFNIRARMLGHSLSPTPTTTHIHPTPQFFAITSEVSNGIEMLPTPEVTAPLYQFLVYGAMRMSLSQPQSYSNWRLLAAKFATGQFFTSITDIWQSAWSLPTIGQPIAVRIDSYSQDMRLTAAIIATTTTVA